MEAALKELFERQTREAEIASEAMKRAEAMAARQMVLLNASDAIKCKAFSVTLKKDALTWFNSLAPGSIKSFSDLFGSFLKNFTTQRNLPKTCLNLYSIVQKPEEPLRDYLDRFNTECT
ncbi:hypothetical protein PIB30_025403 [Stylosanthes scabra]|uniref:Retrotransposon gag domain-containing protein n=1 Tax=Stylosanthes scabra TaxID=79078 RepID=A0ABU6RAI0_9FABA|nr:hypothetical protein [Stylosanthes scabra]